MLQVLPVLRVLVLGVQVPPVLRVLVLQVLALQVLALQVLVLQVLALQVLVLQVLPVLLLACPAGVGAQAVGAPVGWNDVLRQPDAWYGSAEARAVADSVLLYQRDTGGWPKNIDMTDPPDPADVAGARQQRDSTIDNGATYTQIRLLARVFARTNDPRYKAGVLRGIDYLLDAQYPNGGWPQYFPLRDNYSRYITFNDNAMTGVLNLLQDVADLEPPFAFVDARRRAASRAAVEKGIAVILRAQIRVKGELTAWCAQHDAVTLEPRGARSYEHPSLSGAETVGVVRFLMRQPGPAPEIVAAVDAAVAWLKKVTIEGWRVEQRPVAASPRGWDRVMVRDPKAPPLWARFYEIGTNRPIFSGRDGIVRYSLAEIEYERRNGYSWIGEWPRPLIDEEYPAWRAVLR